jgi:hypothetical protein
MQKIAATFVNYQFPALIKGQSPAILVPGRITWHDRAGTCKFTEVFHYFIMPGVFKIGDT